MENPDDEIAPNLNHQLKPDQHVPQVKYHRKKLAKTLENRQQNKEAHAIAAAKKAATVKTIKVPVKLTPGVDFVIRPKAGGVSKTVKDKIKEKEETNKAPSDLDAYL